MPTPNEPLNQAAVLPLWCGKVCLVTSSSGRRWVLPKGTVEAGWTPNECAVQEAWEEAGLIGDLEPRPVGQYEHLKEGLLCRVTVFRMQVTKVLDDWPERELRRRAWLAPAEAIWRLDLPETKELVRGAFTENPASFERIAR